jgi:hypothetical protein
MFEVILRARGPFNKQWDDDVYRVAGRISDWSGTWVDQFFEREHGWEVRTYTEAHAMRMRLVNHGYRATFREKTTV